MPSSKSRIRTLFQSKPKSLPNWDLKLFPFENCLEAMKEAEMLIVLPSIQKSEPFIHESHCHNLTLKVISFL